MVGLHWNRNGRSLRESEQRLPGYRGRRHWLREPTAQSLFKSPNIITGYGFNLGVAMLFRSTERCTEGSCPPTVTKPFSMILRVNQPRLHHPVFAVLIIN